MLREKLYVFKGRDRDGRVRFHVYALRKPDGLWRELKSDCLIEPVGRHIGNYFADTATRTYKIIIRFTVPFGKRAPACCGAYGPRLLKRERWQKGYDFKDLSMSERTAFNAFFLEGIEQVRGLPKAA